MFDKRAIQLLHSPLKQSATWLNQYEIKPDWVTCVGFLIGIMTLPALIFENYLLALVFILMNRIADGIDGALARIQGTTDAGGFLDIVFDFLFYSLVPLGFVMANAEQNGLAGALLIFAFIGTGVSFLAFAAMAGKRGIQDPIYENKSLYYMTGLTEGTETIVCFVLFCLFPVYFPIIAYSFAAMCGVTVVSRIYNGYQLLR